MRIIILFWQAFEYYKILECTNSPIIFMDTVLSLQDLLQRSDFRVKTTRNLMRKRKNANPINFLLSGSSNPIKNSARFVLQTFKARKRGRNRDEKKHHLIPPPIKISAFARIIRFAPAESYCAEVKWVVVDNITRFFPVVVIVPFDRRPLYTFASLYIYKPTVNTALCRLIMGILYLSRERARKEKKKEISRVRGTAVAVCPVYYLYQY